MGRGLWQSSSPAINACP